MSFGFSDDAGFMSELLGAGGYVEANTDVPYQPLGLDGVTVPTEAEAGGIQTEDGFTMDYILGTEAGATGSNFAVERKFDQPMASDKLPTKIKGKKNPKSYWRTKDNSGKLWGRKQKFYVTGDEFQEVLDEPDGRGADRRRRGCDGRTRDGAC